MVNNWCSLLPPFVIIFTVILTKSVRISLSFGILTSLLIVSNFSLIKMTSLLFKKIWIVLEFDLLKSATTFFNATYLFILLFLLFLGIFISLLKRTGGMLEYTSWVSARFTSKRAVEFSSFFFSMLLAMDDYF